MLTFVIGLMILFVGGGLYGAFCQKVFRPDDRKTPAYTKGDGVDYVPMPECFARGGYEVQAGVNSTAQNAATEIIKASIANL